MGGHAARPGCRVERRVQILVADPGEGLDGEILRAILIAKGRPGAAAATSDNRIWFSTGGAGSMCSSASMVSADWAILFTKIFVIDILIPKEYSLNIFDSFESFCCCAFMFALFLLVSVKK